MPIKVYYFNIDPKKAEKDIIKMRDMCADSLGDEKDNSDKLRQCILDVSEDLMNNTRNLYRDKINEMIK